VRESAASTSDAVEPDDALEPDDVGFGEPGSGWGDDGLSIGDTLTEHVADLGHEQNEDVPALPAEADISVGADEATESFEVTEGTQQSGWGDEDVTIGGDRVEVGAEQDVVSPAAEDGGEVRESAASTSDAVEPDDALEPDDVGFGEPGSGWGDDGLSIGDTLTEHVADLGHEQNEDVPALPAEADISVGADEATESFEVTEGTQQSGWGDEGLSIGGDRIDCNASPHLEVDRSSGAFPQQHPGEHKVSKAGKENVTYEQAEVSDDVQFESQTGGWDDDALGIEEDIQGNAVTGLTQPFDSSTTLSSRHEGLTEAASPGGAKGKQPEGKEGHALKRAAISEDITDLTEDQSTDEVALALQGQVGQDEEVEQASSSNDPGALLSHSPPTESGQSEVNLLREQHGDDRWSDSGWESETLEPQEHLLSLDAGSKSAATGSAQVGRDSDLTAERLANDFSALSIDECDEIEDAENGWDDLDDDDLDLSLDMNETGGGLHATAEAGEGMPLESSNVAVALDLGTTGDEHVELVAGEGWEDDDLDC